MRDDNFIINTERKSTFKVGTRVSWLITSRSCSAHEIIQVFGHVVLIRTILIYILTASGRTLMLFIRAYNFGAAQPTRVCLFSRAFDTWDIVITTTTINNNNITAPRVMIVPGETRKSVWFPIVPFQPRRLHPRTSPWATSPARALRCTGARRRRMADPRSQVL